MKQVPSDKYNIAWFKLAECVARGEKERALGVYRLLSHSFDDYAFARQLEGDILLSFKDEGAQACYQEAATLYQEANRLLEAAAVYEHLHELAPTKTGHIEALLDLYWQLNTPDKHVTRQQELVLSLAKLPEASTDQVRTHIQKIIDWLCAHADQRALNQFLSRLEQADATHHEHAHAYLAQLR